MNKNNNKILIFLLLIFIFYHIFILNKIEAKIVIKQLGETESYPRQIVSIPLEISNLDLNTREFKEILHLPQAWQKITSTDTFTLKAGESKIRLLSFLVPLTTLAKEYFLTYTLQEDQNIVKKKEIPWRVLPLYNLSLQALPPPPYILAGDSYYAYFLVENKSNSKVKLALEYSSNQGFHLQDKQKEISLKKGQAKKLMVQVNTCANLKKTSKHILRVKLRNKQSPTEKIYTTSSIVQIIPRLNKSNSKYIKMPAHLRVYWQGSEKQSLSFNLRASAYLDKTINNNKLDFYLRKSIGDFSPQKDEIHLNYLSDNYQLQLGNNSFSLSPLTKRATRAPNLSLLSKNKRFNLGTYITFKQELATFIKIAVNDHLKLKTNYFKDKKDSLVSLEANVNSDNLDINLEYAMNLFEKTKAFHTQLFLQLPLLNLRSNILQADAQYSTKINDIMLQSHILEIPLTRKLYLCTAYSKRLNNQSLASDYTKAFLIETKQFYTNYYYAKQAKLALSYRQLTKRDILEPISIDYNINTLGLSWQEKIKNLAFKTDLNLVEKKDNLKQEKNIKPELNLAFVYPVSEQKEIKLSYTNSDLLNKDKYGNLNLNFQYRLEDLVLDFAYRKAKDRNNFYTSLSYKEANQGSLKLKVEYSAAEFKSYFSLILKEDYFFNIPVGKNKGGKIEGRVYDVKDKQGLVDVIIRLNDHLTVSNEKGKFSFSNLEEGEYYLQIEPSSIPLNKIPLIGQAAKIELKAKEIKNIEIAISKSASFQGQVLCFEPEFKGLLNLKQEEKLKVGTGLSGIIIEINQGQDYKRVITDQHGRFKFDNIRPGKWQVRVIAQNNLPAHYHLEEDTFSIELTAGKVEETLIKVLPQVRTIEILKEQEKLY